jgi:hypothetical protein
MDDDNVDEEDNDIRSSDHSSNGPQQYFDVRSYLLATCTRKLERKTYYLLRRTLFYQVVVETPQFISFRWSS